MNDTAIKNYAVWARRELIGGVRLQMARWAIDEEGSVPASADVLRGEPLNACQRTQRAELLEACRAEGAEALAERAAYTWFNRLAAIRFMELHDYLPCGVRVLSAPDGSFDPQVLREALHVDIEGVDRAEVAALVQAGEREPLFRYLLLRQCDELASCMPAVFERVGSAMELLLPDNLLGEGSVVERMVSDIPESDWTEGVEIVGWMYQYYVSERKDEVFASFKKGKKADRSSIAPATQLFTPAWIVRYLVENSLGRLWMLNRPGSLLIEEMPYFVKLDEDCETEFKKISGPEDITVADPACGSGHILVYAFDLLAKMYLEDGYTARDAARLILGKNISGMEIDPRAAAMASFALTMKALELDSRFLRRAVAPRITVLSRVEFEPEELELLPMLAKRPELLDAVAHFDECGSLLEPSEADMIAVAGDLASLAGEPSLFADSAAAKLERLQAGLAPLSRRYDAVVANPPYMGAKNMNAWLGGWVKKRYPDVKGDLFSCFMVRNSRMGAEHAQLGFMTPYVWMFIGTYEKLRRFVVEENTITSLIQLEYSGFSGATVPICTFTLQKGCCPGYRGGYVRLSDFVGADQQEPRALQALADPDCGWFYRADANAFAVIPGAPIAYWASNSMFSAFERMPALSQFATPRQGLATTDNSRFLRKWWEISSEDLSEKCSSRADAISSGARWFPIIRGGAFRKWFGMYDEVVDWFEDGREMKQEVLRKYPYLKTPDFVIKNQGDYFKPAVTWSKISSGDVSFRFAPAGMLFEVAGACMFADDKTLCVAQGLCNSSVALQALSFLAPTLNYEVGQIASLPFAHDLGGMEDSIIRIVKSLRMTSEKDIGLLETSRSFARSSLV